MPYRLVWSVSLVLAFAVQGPVVRAQDAAAKDQDQNPEEPDKKAGGVKLPGPPPIPEVKLGPTLPTTPVRRGSRPFNYSLVDASVLPREKSPEIDFDEKTADFTRNETIAGKDSGATATIVDQIFYGKNGTLTLGKVKGTFKDGEVITDAKGGSATVKGNLREGIWILDFAFKPVRVRTVEIQGKGRKQVYYLYYRVINRTGKPRMFVPEFNLVTDTGKVHRDVPLPEAVPVVQAREDPATPLLGAVAIDGIIPPSVKPDIDDAVFGVAFWIIDDDLAKADRFNIYVRGLSDSLQVVNAQGKPATKYKTLRIDFVRYGDEREVKESEVHLGDPPYEWIYW